MTISIEKCGIKENMVDDKLIQKLKDFIKKKYKLIGVSKKAPESLIGLKQSNIGIDLSSKKMIQKSRKSSGSTFEDIADTLKGFIRKERKTETFSVMLDKLLKEKGMTPSKLYNGAWIKKQLYSKIMGERNYHPSKNTVIAFGIALKLNREEMDDLLESAGYKFSNSSIADLVILFCLSQELYDLHDVNALLLSADQKVLCRE